jgi:alpha-ribazole phosphatase/probable phosphoglycerate mutase
MWEHLLLLRIVFETHSWSTDNDAGIATGWKHGQLSERGKALAKELGNRRRNDSLDAIFSSDLGRAVETAVIAFSNVRVPMYFDSRLRECNYGDWNGSPVDTLIGKRRGFISSPYPNGQSYGDVLAAIAVFLREAIRDWNGRRLLLIGHSATRWALDVLINHAAGIDLGFGTRHPRGARSKAARRPHRSLNPVAVRH